MAKKANPKPASGAKPAAENTVGQIVPKTAPAPAGAAPSPPVKPETPKEKGLLEKADELLEKGEIKILNDAKNSVAGGIDSLVNLAGGGAAAQVVGAIGKGAVAILLPDNVIDLIPGGKILSGGMKAAKLGKKGLEKLGKEAAEKAKKEALEKAAKEEAEKKAKEATKDGAKKADVSGNKGGRSEGKARNANGKCGEWQARRDLEDKGYEVTSVQNKSGHGIDVVGRNPKTGDVRVLEVKTTQTDVAPPLTGAGKDLGGSEFTRSRLEQALDAKGHWQNQPEVKANAQKVQDWLDQAKERGAKVTPEKYDVFVEDPDKGCIKRKNSQSTPWKAKPKQPRIKK